MATIFWIMEVGFLNLQAVQLDRGVEIAVRDVMINDSISSKTPADAHDYFKDIVCDNVVISDCDQTLKVEFVALNSYEDFGISNGECRDREIEMDPVLSMTYTPNYNINAASCTDSLSLVEVRACLIVDTILPPWSSAIGSAGGDDGAYELHSLSAFLNEPC